MAVEYKATLLHSAVVLANLFNNCVEAFSLTYPSHKWEQEEQLLLTRLGIQQARLLIWGEILGIESPPASLTTHAVPSHPSPTYPDLNEPVNFATRDPRLDEPVSRKTIEDALNGIVDRSSHVSREDMMEKYGLKPHKRGALEFQSALDTKRLEAFREKYTLLLEVAECVPNALPTRPSGSIAIQRWQLHDNVRFGNFINIVRDNIDSLIKLMDVEEHVDRAMRMDIKALGWHVSPDRARKSQDASKLQLIVQATRTDYPEYSTSAQQALGHLGDKGMDSDAPLRTMSVGGYNEPAAPAIAAQPLSATSTTHALPGEKYKRPGLFSALKSNFRKSHKRRSQSISSTNDDAPQRTLSDPHVNAANKNLSTDLEPTRSKSVSAITDVPVSNAQELKHELNRTETAKDPGPRDLEQMQTLQSMISRHDQWTDPFAAMKQ